jgi:hypothetical protein
MLSSFALANGESLFYRQKGARLPYSYELYRWDGAGFSRMKELAVPANLSGIGQMKVPADIVGVTSDYRKVLVRLLVGHGAERDLTELKQIQERYPTFEESTMPPALRRRLTSLSKRIRISDDFLLSSMDGTWKLVSEDARGGPNQQVAMNPSGSEIALCNDKGVKIVPLP